MSPAGTATEPVVVRRLAGFDDPTISPAQWNALLVHGHANVVTLTWEWQSSWWDTLGRGELLLLAVEQGGCLVAIAPFYVHARMIFLVGSGESGYLDFVGQLAVDAMGAVLAFALAAVPDCQGFRFYAVPGSSPTRAGLADAAGRVGMDCYREREWMTWTLDLTDRDRCDEAVRKKSLVRHENYFRRTGALDVAHWRTYDGMATELETFFEQHVGRRAATPSPSAYLDPARREFARTWVRRLSGAGWMRFTRVSWNGRPIAYHLGALYAQRFLWHEPSFAIDLARHSPGEVLLRQLLLSAIDEQARVFDFGTGDDAFKARFASPTPTYTWELYPRSVEGPGQLGATR